MKTIFVTNVGSKLYGINTPQSDTDFKGFCFENVDQIIGLRKFEQQAYSNNLPDGPDKAEGTVYSVKRYIHLCLSGNPTVIEIAFADWDHHILRSEIGLQICEFVKDNFLTKQLFKPYSAYHRAQIRKLQSMERTGKRKEMVEEYGYDLKFAMHAYRLARQCSIVMSEGVLRPTLDPTDKQVCLDLRHGKYTKEEALKLLEDVDKQMYEAYKVSTLPELPDFNQANDFVTDIYKLYLSGFYDKEGQEFNPFGVKEVVPATNDVKTDE